MKTGLPSYFVIFHLIALPIGSIFSIKVIYKKGNHFFKYFLLDSFMVFFFISMIIINQPWYIPIGLFGAGFSIGGIVGLTYVQLLPMFKKPEFAGRYFSTAFIFIFLFVLFEAVIMKINNSMIIIIYIFVLYVLVVLTAFIGRDAINEGIIQEPLKIRSYIKKKNNLPKLGIAFLFGYYWVNTYYIAFLFLELYELQGNLYDFVIFLSITIVTTSFFAGFLADIIGRRIVILIGLMIQALAFSVLSFFSPNATLLLFIFPIVLGIGLSFTISIGLVVFGDLPEYKYMRDTTSIFFLFMGIGMVAGMLLGEVLRPLFREPADLTVILLFIFVCATIVILQFKETLPSKSEIYIKPDIITEEDIALHKERKICIVCKSKVSGILYLCPKCETLYCTKCQEALSKMENMCWVCNYPFEESKPIKPLVDVEKETKPDLKKDKKKQQNN